MKRLMTMGALALLAVSACGSNNASPTAPANPANTNLAGRWTGTLQRPAGLPAVQVEWTATQTNDGSEHLKGPFRLTSNGATIGDATLSGWFASTSDSQAGSIQLFLRRTPTAGSACDINTVGAVRIPVKPGATTLTSEPFTIAYKDCTGFIVSGTTSETTVLAISR